MHLRFRNQDLGKNKSRGKFSIALSIVLLVIGISLAVWLGYRLYMTHYITQQSESAISSMLNYSAKEETDGESDNGRLYADYFEVTKEYQLTAGTTDAGDAGNYHTDHHKSIAKWVKNHKVSQTPQRVTLGDSVYYIAKTNAGNNGNFLIVYVDATSEYDIINLIGWVLVVILSVAILVAGYLGWRLGWSIEEDRKRQKIFFENVSHELKTPLMVIQGYADGMATGVISSEKAGHAIMTETDKMASLVDEIMHLSRLESGALGLDLQEISIEDLLENVLYRIDYQARQRGLEIAVTVTDGMIQADAQQLERALTNLLTNALRYAKTTIQVVANVKEIRVYNDGLSLSPEESKKVFDRFYKGNKGSTGIGLALTKEIITRHKWQIMANGTGKGTEFVIKM